MFLCVNAKYLSIPNFSGGIIRQRETPAIYDGVACFVSAEIIVTGKSHTAASPFKYDGYNSLTKDRDDITVDCILD